MKDDKWFANIHWDIPCLLCQAETQGECHSRGCAEMHYDEHGDPIPASSVIIDGDYQEVNTL